MTKLGSGHEHVTSASSYDLDLLGNDNVFRQDTLSFCEIHLCQVILKSFRG
jgi:hypothetical protein